MAQPHPSHKHSACLSRVSRKQCNCRREKVRQPQLLGCRKLCHGRSVAAGRPLCLPVRQPRMRLRKQTPSRRRVSYAVLPFSRCGLEPADSAILLQPVRRHKRVSSSQRARWLRFAKSPFFCRMCSHAPSTFRQHLLDPPPGRVGARAVPARFLSSPEGRTSATYLASAFLVGERNLLEVCVVAVRTAQVCAGNETEVRVVGATHGRTAPG